MPIQVTCPKCLTRFGVADQHAGKTGACPKCKGPIKIPEASEQIVIHEQESEAGAKDAKGRSVLKPIKRQDAKFQLNTALFIGGGVLLALGLAFFLGRSGLSASAMQWVRVAGAVLLGPLLALGGYTFLRSDEELESFRGVDLLVRCLGCGLAFALAWGVYWYVGHQVFGDDFDNRKLEMLHISILLGIAAGIGTLASFVSFDFEPLVGFFHFALYFAATILLRLAMGASLLPGMGG